MKDFREAAEKDPQFETIKQYYQGPGHRMCWIDGFDGGAKYAYPLGYSEAKKEVREEIEFSERLYKALDVLLKGLAKDGTAIEGFTDGLNVTHEYARFKFDKALASFTDQEQKENETR